MTLNDPGPPPGTPPARNAEPVQPEAARLEGSETEVTQAGFAEMDVTVTEVEVAPMDNTAFVTPSPSSPTAQFASPSTPIQPTYPVQPYPHPTYPQPPSPYGYTQPGYPQPPVPAAPQYGYPQAAYGQPAPPQPAPYLGWGTAFAPQAPPAPRVRIPRRTIAAVAVIIVVAMVAVGAAISMASPNGGPAAKPSTGDAAMDAAVRAIWRTTPAGVLLPASIKGSGSETYIRLAISTDTSCAALPAAFASSLAPTKCAHVISATYVDRTQTVTGTVGIIVLSGTTAQRDRLRSAWDSEGNDRKKAMMPHTYPVPGTVAAKFSDAQRVTWDSQVSSDGTYLVYAVVGFTDGRAGSASTALAAGSGSALSGSSPAVQVAANLPTSIIGIIAEQTGDAETKAGTQ